jgi:hypothetical protein
MREIMQRESKFLIINLVILIAVVLVILEFGCLRAGAAGGVSAGASQSGGSTTTASKDLCLNCHGPFDNLATASPNYKAPSGEKITPHRYVPHNSKDAKAIPGCNNCHEPHPVPPTAAGLAALPKPDVQWCYTTCHHENNFASCKDCHK